VSCGSPPSVLVKDGLGVSLIAWLVRGQALQLFLPSPRDREDGHCIAFLSGFLRPWGQVLGEGRSLLQGSGVLKEFSEAKGGYAGSAKGGYAR